MSGASTENSMEIKNKPSGPYFPTSQYFEKENTDEILTPVGSKSEKQAYSGTSHDMINYEVLKGHQYQILPNPNRGKEKNARIFVCKYDN